MEISINEKNEHNFVCIKCNFKCTYNSDYKRHILTARHKKEMNEPKRKSKKTTLHYTCDCGKSYKNNSGLWKHRQKCNILKEQIITEETIIDQIVQPNNLIAQDSIVNNLIKQNEQLHKLIINRDDEHKKEREEHKKELKMLSEQISKISSITNNTTNNNTTNNNNKFNLNFFLNTQCKDAMSIQSFMENLQLGCKELEHMGDVGYLNGMIDIFNNTIGNMDVYKRPLHCTDLKREVLYFKQGTDWERDSEDKQHLKKLIKNVETKNYYNLQEWQKDHPGSLQCDTPDSEHYMKIATEALGGADSNKDSMYLSKIMKHIVKEVHVKP